MNRYTNGKHQYSEAGFTLIELLVVLVIIGSLVG
jgi:prepilin-type N-terminal cleavage/methylation domain-containing protein